MTSQFPGKCRKCGLAIVKGSEILYDSETKSAFHPSCVEEQGELLGDSEAHEFARERGFLKHDDAMGHDWTVRTLPLSAGSDPAGRE
jgi:hypothetical protein